MKKSLLFSIALIAATAAPSFAGDDVAAKDNYDLALSMYADRDLTDLEPTTAALEVLAEAEAQAENPTLKYDILVLASRALYWNGKHTEDKETRKATFLSGVEKAQAAVALLKAAGMDFYADAYYYAGINLARWAETNGVLQSLGRRCELMDLMANTQKRTARDGKSGATIDGFGPDRVLGKMHSEIPDSYPGCEAYPNVDMGDDFLAAKHLKAAFEGAKSTALNVVYYAEVLAKAKINQKNQAISILKEMLAQDRNTYNTDRTPETIEEFVEGEQLLKELNR